MPEYTRYVTRVETKVVVYALPLTGGEVAVGEFTVRAEARGNTTNGAPVSTMVRTAMERNAKQAHVLGSAVENTERNRLK